MVGSCVIDHCEFNPLSCDDLDVCTDDFCAGGQCNNPFNTDPCWDDGEFCTEDICAQGTCAHNPTNGGLECGVKPSFCLKRACVGGFCLKVPDNEGVECETTTSPCTKAVCIEGSCAIRPDNEGGACDDEPNECTNDICRNGVCDHPSKPDGTSCDDEPNECTDDKCQNGSCQHPNKADNTSCTPDDTICTRDVCLIGVCSHPASNENEPCESDNNTCTDDLCHNGACSHVFSCVGGNCCPAGQTCCNGTQCCDVDKCCGNGVCCADPCEGCISNGNLEPSTPGPLITVFPTKTCIDNVITFTLRDYTDTGGIERVFCTAKRAIAPGGVTYTWIISKPGGTQKTGTGTVAQVTADLEGPYVATFTVSPLRTKCPPAPIIITSPTVTPIAVDLDVDSDNNNRTGLPDRSTVEDSAELIAPGKILCLNDDDDDNNGVLDKDQEPPPASENDLVPMMAELRPSAPAGSQWQLIYNGAVVQVYQSDRATIVPTGQLFNIPLAPNPKLFWIEGISPTTAGPTTITLEVDLDGDGTIDCSDAVFASVIRVDLDVDTDRNGIVEDDLDDLDEDQWLTDRGGIFLVNYDDDSPGLIPAPDAIRFDDFGAPVSEDTAIDGASDVNDIAPLVVRATGSQIGVQFFLKMNADDVKAVHIFEERAPGNQVLWGGWTTHKGDSVDQAFDITNQVNAAIDKDLGIEALFFRGQRHDLPGGTPYEFDGEIDIELVAQATTGATSIDLARVICSDKIRLKVAPYMLLPNTQDPIEIWLDLHPDTDEIATSLGTVSRRTNPSVSQWFQDHVQIGYTAMPNPNTLTNPTMPSQSMHITLRMPYSSGFLAPAQWQDDWPVQELLGPDQGVLRFRNTLRHDTSGSGDFGGNLEIVPPSDEWPLGRIVYGNTMGPRLRDFLGAQMLAGPKAVQDPYSINVQWLDVGHVDEIVSFLPGGSRGFQVAVASPSYADQLLRTGDPARGLAPPSDDTAIFAKGAQASGTASNAITTASKVYLFDGVAHGWIRLVDGATINDGDTVTVSDGTTSLTFEFDKSGAVTPGHVPVTISDTLASKKVRKALLNAINAAPFGISAVPDDVQFAIPDKLILINENFGLAGNVPITDTVVAGGFIVQGMAGGELASDGMDFTGTAWKYIRIFDGPGAGQVARIENASRRGKGWISVKPAGALPTVFYTTTKVVSTGSVPIDGLYGLFKEPTMIEEGDSWFHGEPGPGSRYIVAEDTLHWHHPNVGDRFPALISVLEVKNDVLLTNLNAAAEAQITSAKSVIQAGAGLASSGGPFLRDDNDRTDDSLASDVDSDFLAVPALYFGEWGGSSLKPRDNGAFLPGLVNAQPASAGTILFPKPFGAGVGSTGVFEQAAAIIIGPGSRFANDWIRFHRRSGEVHCATAAKRNFFSFNWWENQP